jgi:hypothetical protein
MLINADFYKCGSLQMRCGGAVTKNIRSRGHDLLFDRFIC